MAIYTDTVVVVPASEDMMNFYTVAKKRVSKNYV